MNTIALLRHALDRYALPLLLAVSSSASIGFGLAWSLHAIVHPLV
ncbi:hypothetical protein [Rhodanobacter sp. PCA2]|nr:hypothetical protein [Rhodanobacter sp. PCA2]